MGCQQCGRQPGDLYCLNDNGCPNDTQYEPRQDWACEPATTGRQSYPIPKFLRDNMKATAEKQAKCKHENRECTYESDDGEFERWQCKDCGARWGVEIAQ
jgi:hypothetical protein